MLSISCCLFGKKYDLFFCWEWSEKVGRICYGGYLLVLREREVVPLIQLILRQEYVYAFFYLDPLQNNAIVTSRCMHYIFFRGGKVKHSDESVLPVTKKEGKGKGKWTIGPRMKNGCTKRKKSINILLKG